MWIDCSTPHNSFRVEESSYSNGANRKHSASDFHIDTKSARELRKSKKLTLIAGGSGVARCLGRWPGMWVAQVCGWGGGCITDSSKDHANVVHLL